MVIQQQDMPIYPLLVKTLRPVYFFSIYQ